MKVVFCADLPGTSSSGHQRLWALEQCHAEVFVLNKQHYKPKLSRWSGHLAKIVRQPRLTLDSTKLEQDLIALCQQVNPDIIWLEWAKEFQPETLKKLKQIGSAPTLISFQDDNPWGDRRGDAWMWKEYFKVIPEFDLHLVKRPADVENLTGYGAQETRIWSHGVYKPVFYPSFTQKKYPVSFIGTCMDGRASLIEFLLEQGVPLHVFGSHWAKRSNLPSRFPANFHSAVLGDDYADVIRQSQICLGLVSHSNQDEWTMRTYEVPGCAGLLLAERTQTHHKLFVEGQEAVFFSSPKECLHIIEQLLPNPDLCAKMGQAAYEKCIQNNWLIEYHMQELLDSLKPSYNYLNSNT